jgi:hypothetical protein
MERGYCTYFATTMVAMLRSQGVPARFAVGYTPGEQVGEDRWLARGLDSHAWVEVYFSDVGWVRFDPTPAEPRREAERRQLNDGDGDASPDRSTEPPATPTATNGIVTAPGGPADTATGPSPEPTDTTTTTGETPNGTPASITVPGTTTTPGATPNTTTAPGETTTPADTTNATPTRTTSPTPPVTTPTETGASTTEPATGPPPVSPSATPTDASGPPTDGSTAETPGTIETPAAGGILSGLPDPAELPRNTLPTGLFLLGGVTLLARVRVRERISRARWLHRAPSGTPAERVEGAYERVEYLLARRFRRRRPDETPREYVDAVCEGATADAAVAVLERYEDARYAGTVTEADAAAAVAGFEALYDRLSAISRVYGVE